jgi:hypothetical protein
MAHLYRPLLRPAVFAGLPKGWYYAEAPPDIAHKRPDLPASTWRYGVIAYERKLTPEEVAQHDLEYLGETQ